MKIVVWGARGNVGRRVVVEALARGHEVTAVVRDPRQLDDLPAGVHSRVADAGDAASVATVCAGQDAVVNTTRPRPGREAAVTTTTRGLLAGVAACEARLLVVGGAATLRVPGAGGRTVLDDRRYLPAGARAVAAASAAQLEVCMANTEVDWVYLSPPATLTPGARTGSYRVGRDELLVDAHGDSRISIEDLAVAVVDEAERPAHHRARFTVGY